MAYSDQARTHFDDSEIIALSKTILEHGIRNPLTVIGVDEGFQVVSGERRLRAAKLAGIKNIPVIIINDDKKAEELALIENIQRVDLHPIELGRAYSKIMSNSKENPQQLAERLSIPSNQVYEYAAFSKIPESLASLIIKHNLGRRAFLRNLLKLSIEDMSLIINSEIRLKDELFLNENEQNIFQGFKNNEDGGRRIQNAKSQSTNLLSVKLIDGSLSVNFKNLTKQSKKNLNLIKAEIIKILKEIDDNL
jgi:ParB family chromosome partitioning protein